MVLFSAAAGLTIKMTDDCDPSPTARIVAVTSDQPPLGGGSGNTAADTVSGPSAFCARSERDGTVQAGRHYTATIEAMDVAGNRAQTTVTLAVPHDQGAIACAKVDPARVVGDADPRCAQ
jgi:hypothetical protein